MFLPFHDAPFFHFKRCNVQEERARRSSLDIDLNHSFILINLFWVNLQIIDEDGALLLKGNFDGGATWAYEVGCQASMCPIIVEDLHPPRQFLVEVSCDFYRPGHCSLCLHLFLLVFINMSVGWSKKRACLQMLCEERGFFLEIADVIRGMGLTILKGVIDKRNDKIWAHFSVEV